MVHLRTNKFHAVKTEVDGIMFDSKKEAARYLELKLLQKAGKIRSLEIHKRWPLEVNGIKIGAYESDFNYAVDHPRMHDDDGTPVSMLVVEDCKGVRTPLYRLKKKIVEALYGIKITET